MGSSAVTYQPGTVEPGWTTTEFYQTIFVQLISVAVAIGSLFKSGFNLDGVSAIAPSVAVAAALIAQIFYSLSRAKVKSAASIAAASVAVARVAPNAIATPSSAVPPTVSPVAPADISVVPEATAQPGVTLSWKNLALTLSEKSPETQANG